VLTALVRPSPRVYKYLMEVTRELAPERWSGYLDSITDDLRNAPISIEIMDAEHPPLLAARGLALQLLTYDRRDDVFEVAAARGGPRLPSMLRHLIDHPVRVEVNSMTSLAPTRIVVDARDGVRTVIRISHDGAFCG
jgi:Family of unknown function (DUF5335)